MLWHPAYSSESSSISADQNFAALLLNRRPRTESTLAPKPVLAFFLFEFEFVNIIFKASEAPRGPDSKRSGRGNPPLADQVFPEPCATLRSSALSGSARAEIRYEARAKPRTPSCPAILSSIAASATEEAPLERRRILPVATYFAQGATKVKSHMASPTPP